MMEHKDHRRVCPVVTVDFMSTHELCVYFMVKGGDFLEWDGIFAAQKDEALRQGSTAAPVKTKYIVSAWTSSIWIELINKL